MRILMIGDVVGPGGCQFLRQTLPALKTEYAPDVVVANGENSASGNGLLPVSADFLLDSGVDVITTGNHALKRIQSYEYYDRTPRVLRPLNLHRSAPGQGFYIHDDPRHPLAVISLQGRAFMDPIDNPYDTVDALLDSLDTRCVLIDFHAEATAEKQALAYYLDGWVSAVIGTHTHVQTADARILPQGTAFMCDVGMCGGYDTVIGVDPQNPIAKLRTGLPARFEYPSDQAEYALWAVVIDIDPQTGKAVGISPLCRRGRLA